MFKYAHYVVNDVSNSGQMCLLTMRSD